jgi:FdhE protein
VVRGILRKLLGQSSEPPAEVVPALAELDRLARGRPALVEPVGLLRAVLPVLFEGRLAINVPSLDQGRAAGKLAAGTPLLQGETVQVDRDTLQKRWLAVCHASPRKSEALGPLVRALERGDLDPVGLLTSALAGSPLEAAGCDAALTTVTLRLTAFPLLARLKEGLRPLRASASWARGVCPTCGSGPLLGELRGLERLLFLRCGWCASDWSFPHLTCPHCGTGDHRSLGYLSVEGREDRERAATCDECQGYVKTIGVLSALSPPELLVADVATLHLDLIASERGYVPSKRGAP